MQKVKFINLRLLPFTYRDSREPLAKEVLSQVTKLVILTLNYLTSFMAFVSHIKTSQAPEIREARLRPKRAYRGLRLEL